MSLKLITTRDDTITVMNSLKSRLFFASALLLPFACAVLGWSLERAYSSSLLENQKNQMTTQAYALMASAELEASSLWLPELMTDDRLNQLTSGISATVYDLRRAEAAWNSRSSAGMSLSTPFPESILEPGESRFDRVKDSEGFAFRFLYQVNWEDDLGETHPFLFAVYESSRTFEKQLEEYRQTLWIWLGGIAALLIVMQITVLLWGLKPITQVIDDLDAVKRGQSDKLNGNYPNELRGMTNSINSLIDHENKQRERYRNTLSDLAHSIKNPVAIISNAVNKLQETKGLEVVEDIAEQNQRINQIISYQLTRAVGQSAAPFHKAIAIRPISEKILAAMEKVYAHKPLQMKVSVNESAEFKGDQGDLMELLGNLFDNACKYGEQEVDIMISQENGLLHITVENDGTGVSESRLATLLRRGERADTASPGQGIGLAVVEDIVQNYGGTIRLSHSSLGGLKAEIRFNNTP